MDTSDQLARRFEEHRPHLRAVAYRMLGGHAEAEDAVQEAWLRLARAESGAIDNLGGWLSTVVGRICLDLLRARRPLLPLEPDFALSPDPSDLVAAADSVGVALLVVLESLTPAERLAFVLHDLFGLPFEEIAPIVDRTPQAARKLASRARSRVRSTAPGLPAERRVVDAFLSAARGGDLSALLAVLDPDVVLRLGPTAIRGRTAVSGHAPVFHRMARIAVSTPILVGGLPGLLNTLDGAVISIMRFTVARHLITEIAIRTPASQMIYE